MASLSFALLRAFVVVSYYLRSWLPVGCVDAGGVVRGVDLVRAIWAPAYHYSFCYLYCC